LNNKSRPQKYVSDVMACEELDWADSCLERLFKCQCLAEEEVRRLCIRARDILQAEDNVQPVSLPCTLVGDIHGQWYDLEEMFAIGGTRMLVSPTANVSP
jgi:serine/threonine-protein phosphatase 2A catalytic subunit